MPPLRPLPDLCLITLFKMMPPNEQMVGSKISPRAVLVRAANRRVKSLVITGRNVEDPSNFAMQPLMDIF
ncbi:hypothetical protein TYRP_004829 [Tyrophagus putrescentiae]|nr:hypothetical protein TYRP_004829 [Tyrophagus putrescentiae]